MSIGSYDVEGQAAEVNEVMELIRRLIASVDDVGHVGGEYERRAVPLDITKLLSVPKELAKIDMEEVAGGLEHDVVIVAVADAKHIRGDAVPGARVCEVLNCSLVLQR